MRVNGRFAAACVAACLAVVLAAADVAGSEVRVEVAARMEPFTRTLLAAGTGGVSVSDAEPGERVVVWQASEEPHGGRVRLVDVERVGRAGTLELDCLRVAEAAGARAGEGPGTFEGLAIDGEDVLVLWRGRVNGRTALVLARWSGRERTVRIEADTELIAEAADLGATLVLVEARLVQSGGTVWIVLRHMDRLALFRREAAGFGLGTRLDPDREDDDGEAVPWTDPELRPAAGFEHGLLWTHRPSGQVWAMTHQGHVQRWTWLQGLSTAITPAVGSVAPDGPHVVMLAAHTPRPTHRGPVALTRANLPAVLRIERDGEPAVFDRSSFEAPPNYPLFAIYPQSLIPLPGARYVAYCRTTGDLLTIEIVR